MIRTFRLFVRLKMLRRRNQNVNVNFNKNRFLKSEHKFKVFVEYRNSKNILIIIYQHNNDFVCLFDNVLNIVIDDKQNFF